MRVRCGAYRRRRGSRLQEAAARIAGWRDVMLVLAGRGRIVLRARTLTVDIVGHDVLLAPWKFDAGLRHIEPEAGARAWQALSMSNFDAAGAEHHGTTAHAANGFLKRLHTAFGAAQGTRLRRVRAALKARVDRGTSAVAQR
jgi:hypothetical protein